MNDPTGRFRPPSAEELNAFRDALRAELGAPVVRRYSGGQDVHGGCGMLAGRAAGPGSSQFIGPLNALPAAGRGRVP